MFDGAAPEMTIDLSKEQYRRLAQLAAVYNLTPVQLVADRSLTVTNADLQSTAERLPCENPCHPQTRD